jgi:3D (Asp-Asp-Asp) domain-containing protein
MKSTFFGSALGLLLAFSVISYSKTFIHQQNPKATKVEQPSVLEVAGQVPEVSAPASTELPAGPKPGPAESAGDSTVAASSTVPDSSATAQTYTATAYSLRGRTASGKPVSRGLIAADPSVLPLGTRVRVEAGSWSGEYLVADTGGAVRGRRIDIWTPTSREAMQFGRRPVKLTVLALGGKRASATSARVRRGNDPAPATARTAQQPAKQDK